MSRDSQIMTTPLAEEAVDEPFGDRGGPAQLASDFRRQLIRKLVQFRANQLKTQQDVAEMMGTAQPAIARLEAGWADPKLSTLERYAAAVGAKLTIDVVADPGDEDDLAREPTIFREIPNSLDLDDPQHGARWKGPGAPAQSTSE
jgi:transcriptional regulator with XRE-family HTH domain